MHDTMRCETVLLNGHNGDEINAYLARPDDPEPRGGVVVIHHMPGYDRATKEMVRRFAELGYDAICPNLHYRAGADARPDDAAAATRAAGGVQDDQLVGDVRAAVEFLRALPSSNGRVGVIGHCSGGRQAVLAACALDLDAAVDCYGAFAFFDPPTDSGRTIGSLRDRLPDLSCPLLGLFGNEDSFPGPDEVDQFQAALTELGKNAQFHRYDGAGHAFFAVDRPSYRVDAANDAWDRVAEFFANNLAERV